MENNTDELIQFIKDDNRELLCYIKTNNSFYTYKDYFDNIRWEEVKENCIDVDNATSNFMLGEYYYNKRYSLFTIPDIDKVNKAKYFYKRSSDMGCIEAIYMIGIIDKSIDNLVIAAENGINKAYYNAINLLLNSLDKKNMDYWDRLLYYYKKLDSKYRVYRYRCLFDYILKLTNDNKQLKLEVEHYKYKPPTSPSEGYLLAKERFENNLFTVKR